MFVSAWEEGLGDLLHGEPKVKGHDEVVGHKVKRHRVPEERAVQQKPPLLVARAVVAAAMVVGVVVVVVVGVSGGVGAPGGVPGEKAAAAVLGAGFWAVVRYAGRLCWGAPVRSEVVLVKVRRQVRQEHRNNHTCVKNIAPKYKLKSRELVRRSHRHLLG